MYLIRFLFILSILMVQASFGLSITLDGTKSIISGSDCSTATYRFGTTTTYQGDNLDIILYVSDEDNDYLGGKCVDTQNGVVSFHIRDRDTSDNVAYMDLQFIVVKHNTLTPVNVDTLTVTNFDLDSNANNNTLTDDVYYKSPLETLISNDSEVLNISGDFYDEYTVKFRGKDNGNCNDSSTLTELSCRAGAIWKNNSTIYARVQNDNAYGSTNWPAGHHRLLQFSFEYKDIAPLISENNITKDCGTYSYSTNGDSWVEGATHSQYSSNLNIQKNISIPDASQLKISFDGVTESNYDYLYIIDESGVEHTYNGNLNKQNDLIIDGSSVTLKFVSDHSIQKEGVTITIESLGCNDGFDFGDAPTNYPHVSHEISSNLYLGNLVPDSEEEQQSSTDALGDGEDDSDGVQSLAPLNVGDSYYTVPVKVFNNTGKDAKITAWIDFDGDGIFHEREALNTNNLTVPSSSEPQIVNVTWDKTTGTDYIKKAKAGKTFMRIRLSTSRVLRCAAEHYADGSDLNYGGNYFVSPDGEVEDYEITIKENNSSSTATCYALTDNSNRLYKVSMKPGANPLPEASYISINQEFNGEGSAYRASNNKFYAFSGLSDDKGPSDLFSIDVATGEISLIKHNLINGTQGTVEGAEFYFNPTTKKETLYVISKEENSKLYAFNPESWSLLPGYPKNTNADLSSLAIDPLTGKAYAIDDYNYDDKKPKVYQLNLTTGATTQITTLQNLADAEGLAFASDGNLYIEDEGRDDLNGKKLYMVNIQTGELTSAAITNSNGDIEGLSCNGTQIALDNPTLRLDNNNSVQEGNKGTTDLAFTVSLSKPAFKDILLRYEIKDIDTTANEDYILNTNLTILIPKGSSSSSIIVKVKGDIDIENDESFSLKLIDATNAILDTNHNSVVGTIINDDEPDKCNASESNNTDTDGDNISDICDDDSDNDGILNNIEYGTCSTGVKTLMSFDDFGTGGRTSSPYTTYCYEDGDGFSSCQKDKGIMYWPGSTSVNDGEYAIVQHPNPDASTYSTWSKQGDHTANKNGRMMVVNASLQADEFYRRSYTVVPNAGMSVDLWILNVVKEGSNIILPNISFKLENMDGEQIGKVVNTGAIPENGIWNHYTLSINPENNSKIQIVLANNADGGSGNDLALDDIRIQQIFCDHDNDGIADYLDLDSDNDGIADNIEAQKTQEYIKPSNQFDDHGIDTAYADGLTPVDTDKDTIVDYLDLDSDNDGIADIEESGLGNNDTDDDNRTNAEVGKNGMDNTLENSDDYKDVNKLAYENAIFKLKESDNDTRPDGTNAHPMKTDFDYRDNAPMTTLSINDVKMLEGDNETSTKFTFKVSFDLVPDRTISFNYKVLDGNNNDITLNATAPSDFNYKENNVTIDNYALSYPITVNVKGDNLVEEDEQFRVVITDIKGAKVSKNIGIGTILNDDAPILNIERINSDTVYNDTTKHRKSFYTQITGKDFDYSIVSYTEEENEKLYAIKDITVKVELIDENSTIKNDIINPLGPIYLYLSDKNSRFNQTKLFMDMDIRRATRDAAFKISYILDENGTLVHGKYNNQDDYNLKMHTKENQEITNYSDHFAIRPASYHIEIKDLKDDNSITYATNESNQNTELNLAAEYNYIVDAYAVALKENGIPNGDPRVPIALDYNSSKDLNVTLTFDKEGTLSCVDENTSVIKNYNFIDGKLDETLSHNNVGKYTLHIEDVNWTNIDKNSTNLGCIINSNSNIADSTGRFGCNIASNDGDKFTDLNMTFQPYKFEFTNTKLTNLTKNNHPYIYMSDLKLSQKMGVNLHSTIIAKGKNNTTLTNFTKGCVANNIQVALHFNGETDQGTFDSNKSFDFNSTNGIPIEFQNILKINGDTNNKIIKFNELNISKIDFLDTNEGNVSIDILYNIQKNFNNTINPIRVNFMELEANTTNIAYKIQNKNINPMGTGSVNNNMRIFYYTRVSSSLENYPETNKMSINTPLFLEVYCKTNTITQGWCRDTMKLTANGILRHGEKTYEGWYLATGHTPNEGHVTNLASNKTNVTTNYTHNVPNFQGGIIHDIQVTHSGDKIEHRVKAEIAIGTDVWLTYNPYPLYTVTMTPVADLTGIDTNGNTNIGYNLMRDDNGSLNGIVEKNGKMSW